jgi:heat shock protein HtpX
MGMVVLLLWLVSLLLAPVISRLMAMAISRKREFLADATAAQYTRNPGALIRALERLDESRGPTLAIGRGAAHLCIVDPGDLRFQRWKGVVGDLFASHPPIDSRIERLRQMGG